MASQYGVNTRVTSEAARAIRIQSSTPIAVVGTYFSFTDTETKIEYYGSVSDALTAFKFLEGTVKEALIGIDDQNVECPIIIKAVPLPKTELSAEIFYGSPNLKSTIIDEINGLKSVAALFGVKPNLIVAPRFSHDLEVATAITSVANRLLAVGIVDLNCNDEDGAMLARNNFGTSRILLRDPYVKVWDTTLSAEVLQPDSARVAGMIAWTDGQWEYGFADSFSNRIMNGIVGTARAVEFAAGQDCEADRLRTNGIGSIINYKGWRTWGGETTDIDPIWQDHTRVRIFDRISEAALDGLFWAIDRRATDVLKSVKDSVEQMLLALKGAGVMIGYDVFWDKDQNTKANITAGKFYLKAQAQNSPIVKRIEINFSYVDRYGDVLMKMIA
jgi:hypothetical protein